MAHPLETPVVFLPAADARQRGAIPCAVIVRTRDEFLLCLKEPGPAVQWLQVEGLLSDPEVWAAAAQGDLPLPLDVIVSNPVTEYSSIYRLVDVRLVRPVRVTIPVVPGFMKALRLAAAVQLPVRLLPGQPQGAALDELMEASDFYLHDNAVEAPVEPFHSLLAAMQGAAEETLWRVLERDPALFDRSAVSGHGALPGNFVATHLAGLTEKGAECATCDWREVCAGFFKWPDPEYACAGVKELFARVAAAAAEMEQDLAAAQATAVSASH